MSDYHHIESIKKGIFTISSTEEFNALALELFEWQASENPVYKAYLSNLSVDINSTEHFSEIPFLPIGFFKNHKVISGNFEPACVFKSSGTSGMQASSHYVKDEEIYRKSYLKGFAHFYGSPSGYRFLGLLPSYLERRGSSLVDMVKGLMDESGFIENGFFLHEHEQLARQLKLLSSSGDPTILIGVSFALLDFAEEFHFPLGRNIIMMETGGMKGRKEEITREEMHRQLSDAFGLSQIHAEYGMTELLSQAYSLGNGAFVTPPWMKVLVRDIQDPFCILPAGKTGALNIIDLANIHSCAFIETQDIGKINEDGTFEVLGRTDSSDVRGCSLMIG